MNRKLFPALVGILSACLASTAYGQPLEGSGEHLPFEPFGERCSQDREIIEESDAGFKAQWTVPAELGWVGNFQAKGPLPSGTSSVPGLTVYHDFTGLTAGHLPAGTKLRFGDVDFGSGETETFTLNAWDLNNMPITGPWLDVPNGVWSPTGNPPIPASIDMPGWAFVAGEYFIDGTTVPGNPNVAFMLPTNQDISKLTVVRNSVFANFNLAAPAPCPQPTCDDITRFRTTCSALAFPGQLVAFVRFLDGSFDGKTIIITVDGVDHVVTIGALVSGMAVYSEPETPGPHDATFSDPDCCGEMRVYSTTDCP